MNQKYSQYKKVLNRSILRKSRKDSKINSSVIYIFPKTLEYLKETYTPGIFKKDKSNWTLITRGFYIPYTDVTTNFGSDTVHRSGPKNDRLVNNMRLFRLNCRIHTNLGRFLIIFATHSTSIPRSEHQLKRHGDCQHSTQQPQHPRLTFQSWSILHYFKVAKFHSCPMTLG